MRRSVHLATTHRAGDVRIFQKECRTLRQYGYEVHFIVPHPKDERIDGIEIKGVPIPRSGKERMTRTTWAVYRRAFEEPADAVFHLHDSDLVGIGLLLKQRGRTVIYDAHEDTPKQMYYQHWLPRPLRPLAALGYGGLERLAGRSFDAIIAAEPENARRFPPAKTTLVRNFPIVDELIPETELPYAERPPLVSYVGNVTLVRGLREMMAAVARVERPPAVRLALGGGFNPSALADEVEAFPGADRTDVLGYLARPDVRDLLGRSRVGIVVLHPVRKYREAYPTKLFEYMAAGVPVISSDFPVWRAFVEEAECGLVVDPLDVDAIAGAIQWLLDHPAEAEAMGERGRQAVRERYAWRGEAEQLLECYRRLPS